MHCVRLRCRCASVYSALFFVAISSAPLRVSCSSIDKCSLFPPRPRTGRAGVRCAVNGKRGSQAVTALPCASFQTPAPPTPRLHLAITKVFYELSTFTGRHSVTVAVALPPSATLSIIQCANVFHTPLLDCHQHCFCCPFITAYSKLSYSPPTPRCPPSLSSASANALRTCGFLSSLGRKEKIVVRGKVRLVARAVGIHSFLSCRWLGNWVAALPPPLQNTCAHTHTHIFIEPFSLSQA